MRFGDGYRAAGSAAFLAAALALSACSTGGDAPAANGAPREDSLATKLIMGQTNPAPPAGPVDDQLKRDCPPVDILEGTAAYRVYEPPQATDAFSIRYQANISETARECSNLGVEAAIRVGVTGRVIVGPKGVSGVVRLPLRVAVVDDKGAPVYSQIHPIAVTIPPGKTQVEFPHIEDGIVVPIPANRFRGWRIIVGYDAKGEPAAAKVSRRR